MKRIGIALCALFLAWPAVSQARPPRNKKQLQHFNVMVGMGRGNLGVQVQSLTEELRDFFGAPKDRGILVARVEAESPAARAGLKVGDVVTEVEGTPIDQSWDVFSALSGKKKGEKVKLTVVRDKKTQTMTATLDQDAMTFHAGGDDFMFGFPDGMDFDIDIDAFGPGKGRVWSFGHKSADMEKRIKELEERLEKLEKKK